MESSKTLSISKCKIVFTGKWSTRKTETILRNFPKVAMIDTEGNAHHCIGMPEIPEFLLEQTKDPRRVLQILKDMVAKKYKFSDGSLPETIAIDSGTILWNMASDMANTMGEQRAEKYNKTPEKSNATMLDWGIAKRPVKRINMLLDALPVKWVILTSRMKDVYEKDQNGNEKKVGEAAEVMKGTEHEVNLMLEFFNKDGEWSFITRKTQGLLSTIFPIGRSQTSFPWEALRKYGERLTGKPASAEDTDKIVDGLIKDSKVDHTKTALVKLGKSIGMEGAEIGKALEGGGFLPYDEDKYDEMAAYLQSLAAQPA